MKDSELIKRLEHLIAQGNLAISRKILESYMNTYYVPEADYVGFKGAALSFIENLFGKGSTYFDLFGEAVNSAYPSNIQSGISLLEAIRVEVNNGWLINIRAIVAAEVFSDFLEMSKYLLDEGYWDAAAVMIGSTLEEHLRQLCLKYGVDSHYISNGDNLAKKANLINTDLRKANVYGALEDKQVIAWLAIRNSAAHGKYKEYTKEMVDLMYQGVLDFITRVK